MPGGITAPRCALAGMAPRYHFPISWSFP